MLSSSTSPMKPISNLSKTDTNAKSKIKSSNKRMRSGAKSSVSDYDEYGDI